MRVDSTSLLQATLALRNPQHAVAAVEALRGNANPIVFDGLFELIALGVNSRAVIAALQAINEQTTPLRLEAIRLCLQHQQPSIRMAALQILQSRWEPELAEVVHSLLRTDPSWMNRRTALMTLNRWQPSNVDWLLDAIDDPHWRVRHALIRELLDRVKRDAIQRAVLRQQIEPRAGTLRTRGMLHYFDWATCGTTPNDWAEFEAPNPILLCPFWDWDPAVLARKLKYLGPSGRTNHLAAMPFLAGHEDERVWKQAIDTIRKVGEPQHYAAVIATLDDPRRGTQPAIERLFDGLDEDTIDEVRASIAADPTATPAQRDWPTNSSDAQRATVEYGPFTPFARANQLTPEQAQELVANPERETSWHVLHTACRLAKVPYWSIEPETAWQPPERITTPATPIEPIRGVAPHRTILGNAPWSVSRIGISGHYLLPVEGFTLAAEAGVNWFFWEPNYATLTDFSTRLSMTTRQQFHFVAGTFEAEPATIRRDVERALRLLKVEQLGLFLLFWVQSWDRLTDDVRQTMHDLQQEGKVATIGLSSHNRTLLVQAMETGWNPIMARHSAAHRGAEVTVLPKAIELGVSVITFNNLNYGRMLQPIGQLNGPDPADCYRYTLSTPGVQACWSAPSTIAQLQANLAALKDPVLPAERREELQRFGAKCYEEETAFRRLVRLL